MIYFRSRVLNQNIYGMIVKKINFLHSTFTHNQTMVIKYYVNCPWNLLGVVLNIFNLNTTRRASDLFTSKDGLGQ